MLKKGKISKKYNKIVWGFISLSIVLVLFVGYFAFAQTKIIIYPAQIEETASFQVTLNDLDGEISETEVEGTKIYTGFKETTIIEGEGRASGIVTIFNNYSADQPMVATTRLLSKEGVLFRTQENINAPAGGSVDVNVLADVTGTEGDIGPSTFEVVALNAAKKQSIYGESTQAMTGGTTEVAIVTEDDIKKASEELSKQLADEAIENLKAEAEHPDNIKENTVEKRIVESDVSHEVGDEVSSLEVYEKIKVSNISFNEKKFLEVATKKLEENLDLGTTLVTSPAMDNIEYAVLSIDEDGKNAVIKITVHGTKQINGKNSILDKSNITNKTKNSIKKYFNNFAEIDQVEVDFSPFWVQTSPLMENQIDFEIRDLQT
ncbi:baseplate J/gp47 family protein [Patescibacteria group bacterium]|nr:baseplate J/gp47 family protein [Patescibacteria group bacterium]MBU1672889.1 baseplate J/gp47 family protein [Patescibacteria group bacterium]MBU1963140.1 baseplate J/gp47 family protein [Patescibacteria group bacterium]